MTLRTSAKRATTVGLGVLAALAGASTADAAITKTLDYTCNYPLVGEQPLTATYTIDVPATIPNQAPTSYGVSAEFNAGGDTGGLLTISKTASFEGTATLGASVEVTKGRHKGSTIGLSTELIIGSTPVETPWDPDVVFDGVGQTAAVIAPKKSTLSISLTTLSFNLIARRDTGTPVPLGDETDSDGDRTTFDVTCTVNPGQDTTVGTVTTS